MTKLEELKLAVDKTVEACNKAADDGCTEAWQWAWEAWEMACDAYLCEIRRVNFRGLNDD
jgi:hypothetical protein